MTGGVPTVALAPPFGRAAVSVLAQLPPRPDTPACLADATWSRRVLSCSTVDEQRERAEERVAIAQLAPTAGELAALSWTARLYHDAAHAADGLAHATAVAAPAALRAVGAFTRGAGARLEPWLALSDGLVVAASLHEPAALRAEEGLDVPSALAALEDALAPLVAVAPGLAGARVELVPALRLRGRAFEDVLWVGLPSAALGVDVAHAAWQAAHEATVREVTARVRDAEHAAAGARVGHAELETFALSLLATRVRDGGAGAAPAAGSPYRRGDALAASHAAWLAHFAAPWPERVASRVAAVGRDAADPVAAWLDAAWRSGT